MSESRIFLKFVFVGCINTAIGTGIMMLFYHVFGCSYWISSVMNYLAGGVVSFVLNKRFTFQSESRTTLKQVCMFACLVAVCYGLSYGLMKLTMVQWLLSIGFSQEISDTFGMLGGAGLYMVLNYMAQRFVIFNTAE